MTQRGLPDFPDGITPDHTGPGRGAHLKRWLPLPVLGGVLLLALTGVFGGGPARQQFAEGSAASLQVVAAGTLRNGQIFEMRFHITAIEDIARPTLAVDAVYWRNLTLNTIRPEAVSQGYAEGDVLLEYDGLKKGESLLVVIEGQVNPVLGQRSRGRVGLRDGEAVLAELPFDLKVLP